MKWNAKPLAGFGLMFAACTGGANAQSIGAQAWGDPYAAAPQQQQRRGPAPLPQDQDQASETWRAADGTIRTRQRTPAPTPTPTPQYAPPQVQQSYPVQQPQPQSSGAGAGYAVPGSNYPAQSYTPPQPQRYVPQQQPAYAPPQQQSYAPPQDVADPTAGMNGPRGSSQPGAGEQRYDEVGYAGVRGVSGGGGANEAVVAVHRSLPANSVVEVTSLETGRTALVLITGAMDHADRPIDLSEGAARQLGLSPGTASPVRVRSVVATPQDMLALRAGRPAGGRPDAPPVLVNALRKRLTAPPTVSFDAPRPAYTPSRPAATAPRSPAATAGSGRYFVQVAALSSSPNAQSLARSLGGSVKAGGGLYRVQLGPFATTGEAERARAGAARAGYGDARVFAVN